MDATLVMTLAAAVAVLAVAEVLFRRWYKRRAGRDYFVALKFPWRQMPVVAHPFLSFAYRRNSSIDINQRLPYDLHPFVYRSFHKPIRINNFGHFGPDFTTEKPANVLRIACLGHSTTGNNIADEERDYTYPGYVREHLQRMLDSSGHVASVEVYNCGIGGWLSMDIMIDFMLNILHTRPDYAVFKLGYNDLFCQLQEDFELDYSHNRRNLGEVLAKIKRGYYLPKIRCLHLYEYVTDRLFSSGNVRNEVLRNVLRNKPDPTREFANLGVEVAVLENMLVLCRHHGIRPVVLAFPYYDFSGRPLTKKLAEGVAKENDMFRALARRFGAPLVDLEALLPRDEEHFLDEVHFTPMGMDVVGHRVAEAIAADYFALHPADGTSTLG